MKAVKNRSKSHKQNGGERIVGGVHYFVWGSFQKALAAQT